MNAGSGSLADDQVHEKVFHCRVEDFFYRGLQAMNFV